MTPGAGATVRETVTFVSGGERCVATLCSPSSGPPSPVLVFCPGMSLVKEVWLPEYGQRFAEAGYAALYLDYRSFGESAGEPRRRLIPQRQVEDVCAAIDAVRAHPRVDADRVGVFGASLGAGVAVGASAAHPAVRATVAVAGPYDLQRVWSAFPGFPAFRDKVAAARARFDETGEVTYLSVAKLLSSDPETVAKLVAEQPMYPRWSLDVTFESLIDLFAFQPELVAQDVAALMVIQPIGDALITRTEAESVIARATAPKRLVWLPGVRHVDIYGGGAAVDEVYEQAKGWFDAHLAGA